MRARLETSPYAQCCAAAHAKRTRRTPCQSPARQLRAQKEIYCLDPSFRGDAADAVCKANYPTEKFGKCIIWCYNQCAHTLHLLWRIKLFGPVRGNFSKRISSFAELFLCFPLSSEPFVSTYIYTTIGVTTCPYKGKSTRQFCNNSTARPCLWRDRSSSGSSIHLCACSVCSLRKKKKTIAYSCSSAAGNWWRQRIIECCGVYGLLPSHIHTPPLKTTKYGAH